MNAKTYLATVSKLEKELAAECPFASEIATAEASIEIAKKQIELADTEPADMTPEEIVELRESGTRKLGVAEIVLRRAVTKRENDSHNRWSRVDELKGEVRSYLFAAVEKSKNKIQKALADAIGDDADVWIGRTGGELQNIISRKAQPFLQRARLVEGTSMGYQARVTAAQKLAQIRTALEFAATVED